MNIINPTSEFNKNIKFLFCKEKRENKKNVQIDPIFNKMSG